MASVKFRYLLRQESRTGARSYMPLMHNPPLTAVSGIPNSFRHSVTSATPQR